MAVTITDVARAAGVSPSTVSRAISAPERVDPATRQRILRVAEHLGYHPNRAARGLITGRTGNLGLILPDLTNPFFPSLVKAVQQQAHRSDYQVLMMDTDEDPAVEIGLVRSLAKQVDGIILCSARMRPAHLREAASLGPTVLVNRRAPRVPAVLFDDAGGMLQVVGHLADLGHRHLGFAAGPRTSWSGSQRLRALRQVSAERGIRLEELGHFPPTVDGGRGAAEGVLLSGVTAVLAYNDLVAVGLCHELVERGIDVPAGLSVVGIDDIPVAGLVRPALTTLALRTELAGRAAVDLLIHLLTDHHAAGHGSGGTPQVDVPTELVVRGTTAAPRRRSVRRSRSRPPTPTEEVHAR